MVNQIEIIIEREVKGRILPKIIYRTTLYHYRSCYSEHREFRVVWQMLDYIAKETERHEKYALIGEYNVLDNLFPEMGDPTDPPYKEVA